MADTCAVLAGAPTPPAPAHVLDLDDLAGRLTEATATSGSLTRPYLRLKPGTSCVLAATWEAAGHEPQGVVARAYAPHALPKLDKTVRKADPADVLLVDRDAGLVVTTWRADRDVPGLRVLTDDRRRAAWAATLPAGLRRAFDLTPRLVRHNPERRAVLRADGPGGALTVRAVRPADVGRVVRGYAALAAGPVASPAVLAVDEALGLVVTAWLDGTPVDGLPREASLLRRVGETVAALHARGAAGIGGGGGAAVSGAGRRGAVSSAAEAVALLLPGLADDARRLARRLEVAAPGGAGRARVLVHGDLSLDQVVLGPDGELGLVDADAAGPGDAVDDLGSLVASLVRDDVTGAPRAARSVLDGYRAAGGPVSTPVALRHATAAQLLRRATEPFRHLEPGWHGACAALLAAARDLLDDRGELARALDGPAPHVGPARAPGPGPQHPSRPGPSGRPASSRVRYAPRAVEIAVRLAEDGRTLRATLPRSAEHLLLVGTAGSAIPTAATSAGGDPRVLAGQWFADRGRAARVVDRLGPDGTSVATDRGAVVVHHDGADLHLPGLAAAVRRPGARLVAHRPGRRGVVRDPGGTYTKLVRPGRSVPEPVVPDGAFATPAVVSRGDGSVTTSALPGRTLHALLADPSVPDEVLVRAGRAVGRGLRRLQAGPDLPAAHRPGADPRRRGSAPPARHDAAAELAVVERWWSWAVAHEAATPTLAHDVLGRAEESLRGLVAAAPVPTHRDLHDKQLLVDEAAPDRVGLLDLDLATTAHPALDLANLLVHLELRALQGTCVPGRARAVAAAVVEGFAPHDDVLAALPAWSTAARARLVAVYAFRPAPGDVPGLLLATVLDGRPTPLEGP